MSVRRLTRRKRSKRRVFFLNFELIRAETVDVVAHHAVASFVAD